MTEEKRIVSQGVEILSTLFFNKKKKGVFDIPTYMLLYKLDNDDTPVIKQNDCVYGSFLRQTEVDSVIFSDKYESIDRENQSSMDAFRRDVIRAIIDTVDPGREDFLEDEAFISQDDMRDFLKIMVENKVRADKDVKEYNTVILQYHLGTFTDPEAYKTSTTFAFGDNESIEYNELSEEELAEMEKRQLKKYTHEDYHPFVDRMNLVALKRLLTDFAGRHFIPKGRQAELLANMKRYCWIAASRRSGKTFIGGYLAARQLYLPNQIIIIVVPTLRNHGKSLWRYLRIFLGDDTDVHFNKTDWEIRNEKTDSEITFLTGNSDHAVRGQAANLLIFDEAAFLSETVFITASALIATTGGIIYGISTVNPDTPKNWFYYQLVSAEMQKYNKESDYFGKRITLHENPFIDDREKKRIIHDGKKNMKMFQAERMAEFQEVDEFDMNKFWIIDYDPKKYMINGQREVAIKDDALVDIGVYTHYIISHDGARLKDKPGVSVIGIKKSGADIVMSGYMDGFEYYEQVKLLLGLRKLLGESKTDIVIDYRNAGIAVEEIFRKVHNVHVICVQATGGNSQSRSGKTFNIGKDLMRAKFKSAISRGALRGFSFMSELKVELETYDELNDDRNNGHHYDILNSLFILSWLAEKRGYLEIYNMSDEERQKEHIKYAAGQMMSVEGNDTYEEKDRFSTFGY